MSLKWPIKDINEKLDYGVDWSKRLKVGETIVTSTFSVLSGGLTKVSEDYNNTESLVRLEGGTAGLTAKLVCEITTSATPPRTYRVDIQLPIVNRAL